MNMGHPYINGMPTEEKTVSWYDLKKRSGIRNGPVWVRFRLSWRGKVHEGTALADVPYHVSDKLRIMGTLVPWECIYWLDMGAPDPQAWKSQTEILTLEEVGENRLFAVGTTESDPDKWRAWDEVELVCAGTAIEAVRICGYHHEYVVAEVDMSLARSLLKAPAYDED